MTKRLLTAALGLFLALPAAAPAATFTSFWVLGDSLSDPGNLHAATGGAIPASPPYAGRASNGPVWAEAIAAEFASRGLATGNFAWAGAHALDHPDDGFEIPDLSDQIEAFAATAPGRLGGRGVAALWFGANDIFGALEAFAASDPPSVLATAASAARTVVAGVEALSTYGIRNFAVFNLPPLERTPFIALSGSPGLRGLAGAATDLFNTTLSGLLPTLSPGLDVTILDVEALLEAAIANPSAYGFVDATFPCYVQGAPAATACSPEEAARKVFFDTVHPTTAAHGFIADLAREAIAPVPLPATLPLMLLAAGGLASASRRRR